MNWVVKQRCERNQKQVCLKYFDVRCGLCVFQQCVCADKDRWKHKENYTHKTSLTETALFLIHVFSRICPQSTLPTRLHCVPTEIKKSGFTLNLSCSVGHLNTNKVVAVPLTFNRRYPKLGLSSHKRGMAKQYGYMY